MGYRSVVGHEELEYVFRISVLSATPGRYHSPEGVFASFQLLDDGAIVEGMPVFEYGLSRKTVEGGENFSR